MSFRFRRPANLCSRYVLEEAGLFGERTLRRKSRLLPQRCALSVFHQLTRALAARSKTGATVQDLVRDKGVTFAEAGTTVAFLFDAGLLIVRRTRFFPAHQNLPADARRVLQALAEDNRRFSKDSLP